MSVDPPVEAPEETEEQPVQRASVVEDVHLPGLEVRPQSSTLT
jgi:hypothetical protein